MGVNDKNTNTHHEKKCEHIEAEPTTEGGLPETKIITTTEIYHPLPINIVFSQENKITYLSDESENNKCYEFNRHVLIHKSKHKWYTNIEIGFLKFFGL